MKLINSSVEIIPQKSGLQGIYEQIELAARTCYKSESNIKYDEEGNSLTAKDFVDKIVNVYKHRSVAEHGTVYLKAEVKESSSDRYGNYSLKNPLSHYSYNKYSTYTLIRKGYSGMVYVTTNYRVLLENGWLKDLQYLCEPTEYHEKRVTVRVKCSISVSREWNRHRDLCKTSEEEVQYFGISEQSTRYCNYSKEKFGNQITFCKPYWIQAIEDNNDNKLYEDSVNWFYNTIDYAEDAYLTMIDNGLKPQEAREVLPLCTATEVVYTGFVSDWKHFFELRTAENAHPDIRKLAIELQEQFKQQGLI
jgi:thymidylate synthase (FAD)